MKNEHLYLLRPPLVNLETPKVNFERLFTDTVGLEMLDVEFGVIHRAHYVAEGSGYTDTCLRTLVAHKVMYDYEQVIWQELHRGVLDGLDGWLRGVTSAHLHLHGFVLEGRDEPGALQMTRDDLHKVDTIIRDIWVGFMQRDHEANNPLVDFNTASDRLFRQTLALAMRALKGKANPTFVAHQIERVLGCKALTPEQLNPGLGD